MSQKQYLDYEGLEHYTQKIKQELQNGGASGGSDSGVIGDIKYTINPNQPDSWLYCNGENFKNTDYPLLASQCSFEINALYGTPDESEEWAASGNEALVQHRNGYWTIVRAEYTKTPTTVWKSRVRMLYTTDDIITWKTEWKSKIICEYQATSSTYSNVFQVKGSEWFDGKFCIGVCIYLYNQDAYSWSRVYYTDDLDAGEFQIYTVSSNRDNVLYGIAALNGQFGTLVYNTSARNIKWYVMTEFGGSTKTYSESTSYTSCYTSGGVLCSASYYSSMWNSVYREDFSTSWQSIPYSVQSNWPTSSSVTYHIVSIRYQEDTKKWYALMCINTGQTNSDGVPYLYFSMGEADNLSDNSWTWSGVYGHYIYGNNARGIAGYADGYFIALGRAQFKITVDNTTYYTRTGLVIFSSPTIDGSFQKFDPAADFPTVPYNGYHTITHNAMDSYGPCIYAVLLDNSSTDSFSMTIVSVSGISYSTLPSIASEDGYAFIKGA